MAAPPDAPPGKPGQRRSPRRRRPSGEPAPLPAQPLARIGKMWVAFALVVAGVLVLLFTPADRGVGTGQWWNDLDALLMQPLIDARNPTFTEVARALHALGSAWTIVPIVVGAVTALVAYRRWRHLIVYASAMLITIPLVWGLANMVARPRPDGIEILGDWTGYAQPSSPVAVLTVSAMGAAYALLPAGPARRRGHVAIAAVVALLAIARIYLGADRFSDGFSAAVIGVTAPLLLFRIVVPDAVFPVSYSGRKKAHLDLTGMRKAAIIDTVRQQFGIEVNDIAYVGLDKSGGSTPLLLTTVDDGHVFAKLYAQNHIRADRWYKFGRSLLYGALEDEASFRTVRRIAEHEDYTARLMVAAGVPVPEPIGLVEMTPGREYLLLSRFLEEGVPLTEANCSVAAIESGLGAVATMWEHGLAHRDIKPGNMLVVGSTVHLVDHSFDEVCPTPWRQATDLANMMLTLATVAGPERVLECAGGYFTEDEMAEAFAATHPVTIPSELRTRIKQSGRDLVAEFRSRLPATAPIPIQRWTWRRVLLLTGLVAVVLATVQLIAVSVSLLP